MVTIPRKHRLSRQMLVEEAEEAEAAGVADPVDSGQTRVTTTGHAPLLIATFTMVSSYLARYMHCIHSYLGKRRTFDAAIEIFECIV